ncbi:ATP-binding cassette domain-containing protein [Nonomuraea recticatena]|uniref:ATP-binding cassette domain-containing protein n=1 Tax=Nonomuraea recticatena TaxID=46178 RepID=UPI00361EAFE6
MLLRAGDRLVVTGPNGCGKSSLLAVLAGTLAPDAGSVQRKRGRGWGCSLRSRRRHRGGGPSRSTTPPWAGSSARASSTRRSGSASRSSACSSGAAHRPVSELSVGQQRRLDLAVLLGARPHLLLLDEPTNHLSMALVEELTQALAATGAAVVLATHDRQLLRDTATWPRLHL